MTEPKLALNPKEAARMLDLSESTLAKLRLSGGGPAYSKLGSRVVYQVKDLQEYLQANRRRSTADGPLKRDRRNG